MSEKLDPLKLAEESGAKLGEEMERELRNLETASGGGGANLNVAESIAATTPDNSEAGTGKADGLKEEVGKNLPEKSPAEAEKSTVELAGAIEIKKDGTEKAGKKELLSAEKLKEAVKKARTEYLKSEIDAKKADTVLSRLGKLRERLFSKKKEKTDDEKLKEYLGEEGSSRKKEGGAKRDKEEAKEISEEKKNAYEEAKTFFAKGLYDEKMRSFEEKVKTGGKDRGPMTPEEQAKALAELKFEIIKVAVLDEKENFNKAKFEALPPKEKGLCLKAMARYGQLPQWSKVLISASAATGMTLAFSSGVGFAMIGGVFAWKAVRAGAGTAAGLLAGKGYNWAFDKIVDVKNIKNKGQQEIIAEIEKNLIGGGSKEGSAEKKEEEFEKWFSRTAASTNQKLDSLAKKEKRILLGKAIGQGVVIAGVAGLTSMGMEKGMAGLNPDLASKMGIKIAPSAENGPKAGMAAAVETPAEAAKETQILKIGVRGPEGAIIDNFKAKPELAKAFGWDGKTLINEWAGTKAHQLWLKSVEEELSRPEMVEKLKAQGFTADAEGYAKAMHRIGKGSVEIAPTGEVRLADDTSFLKETVQPDRPSIVLGQEGVPAAPETPGAQKLPEPGAQEMPPKPKVDPLLSPENLKIKEAVTRLIEPEILTDKTFKAAAGVKLGKILEAVPPEIYADKYALSRYWQGLSEVGVKTPDLPGSSWLGLTYDDFRKYSEMAKFLRENPALKGVAGLENMTVEEFLKNYGGDLGKGIKNQAGSNLSEVIGAASPAKGTVNLPEPTSGARIDLPEPTEIKKPGE